MTDWIRVTYLTVAFDRRGDNEALFRRALRGPWPTPLPKVVVVIGMCADENWCGWGNAFGWEGEHDWPATGGVSWRPLLYPRPLAPTTFRKESLRERRARFMREAIAEVNQIVPEEVTV